MERYSYHESLGAPQSQWKNWTQDVALEMTNRAGFLAINVEKGQIMEKLYEVQAVADYDHQREGAHERDIG